MDSLEIQKLKTLKILYVEDEHHIREKISDTLRFYVKEIIQAKNGKEGYEKYLNHQPDIILSDILMPILDGISMVKKIRKSDISTPIVMLTAHTEKEYLLSAVKLYLENYLIKPIALPELLKVLHSYLQKINTIHSLHLILPEGYNYDFDHKNLTFNKKIIKLNKKEISFLELLVCNKHRIVTYEELQIKIWKDNVMTDNAIRSLVNALRKKLPSNIIVNLSGIGYKLKDE